MSFSSGSDISSESSLRTIHQQQSTFLNGSVILTSQEDIEIMDTGEPSVNFDSNNILIRTGDSDTMVGPDIISHTNPVNMKHRRKIIAIPVDGDKSGITPQAYRELNFAESYHEGFKSQGEPIKMLKSHFTTFFNI